MTGEVKSVDAFNTVIDPEAAQIVLKAGFHSIVVTDLMNTTVAVDSALVEALKKEGSELSAYLVENAWKDLPLWDEVIAEPVLMRKLSHAASRSRGKPLSDGVGRSGKCPITSVAVMRNLERGAEYALAG